MEPDDFWNLFNKINKNDNGNNDKIHLIFICAGNICRSPFAEMKFKQLLESAKIPKKIKEKFLIQSGGFINQKDVRIHKFTEQALMEENIPKSWIDSHFPRNMRKFKDDMINADVLIAMTKMHRDILIPKKYKEKVILLSSLGQNGEIEEIPDPALYDNYEEYSGVMHQITGYLKNMIMKLEEIFS
ncbi:MAG: arsenate-mycothiol transferase ArsC [Promethearchaeota archaeon]